MAAAGGDETHEGKAPRFIEEVTHGEADTMVSGTYEKGDARYGRKTRAVRRRDLRAGFPRADCHVQPETAGDFRGETRIVRSEQKRPVGREKRKVCGNDRGAGEALRGDFRRERRFAARTGKALADTDERETGTRRKQGRYPAFSLYRGGNSEHGEKHGGESAGRGETREDGRYRGRYARRALD